MPPALSVPAWLCLNWPLPVQVYIVTHLSQHTSGEQRESLGFHVVVVFGVFVLLTVMWPFAFILSLDHVCLSFFFFFFWLPLSHPSPSTHRPFCCLSRFLLHSAIQTMSGTMAVRIKATGFSRFMMNCRCLTEAASKIHWERVEHKPINYQQQLICVKLSQVELLRRGCRSRPC